MGGSSSTTTTETSSPETELKYGKPWRETPWGEEEQLEKRLREFKLNTPNIKHVRILVIGEIGSGKSSFINSVNSVFQKRITNEALVNKTSDSRTFTKLYKTYYTRNGQSVLPFVLTDTMGLEDLYGIQQDDVVKAMEGFIKERYKFNPSSPISPQDEGYRNDPSLQDRTYCLVYVMPADKISLTRMEIIDKFRYIRNKANELEIPQVIIMTRVDEVCPLVKKTIRTIYTSKKIKEKMEECSEIIGIPVSHVFPVKSYHEEIDTQADIDVLLLRAFTHIVHMANDALTVKSNENRNSE